MKIAFCWSLVISLTLGSLAFSAVEALESNDFAELATRARAKAVKHGKQNVLVVFDIDNTIMTTNQDLGSDHWFTWQETLLNEGKPNDYLVAKDFGGLLAVQGILYSISGMRPTQPNAPQIIRELQKEGFPTMVLTARGYDFRDSTERELARNGYDFSRNAPGPKGGYAGSYLPFDSAHPEAAGFTAIEIETFQLKKAPRLVSYQNGIFMSAGQHKGVMLRTLLKKADVQYRSILFTDDLRRQTDRVAQAFAASPVELVTVRYTREDMNKESFQQSDDKKRQVHRSWKALESAINEAFQGS